MAPWRPGRLPRSVRCPCLLRTRRAGRRRAARRTARRSIGTASWRETRVSGGGLHVCSPLPLCCASSALALMFAACGGTTSPPEAGHVDGRRTETSRDRPPTEDARGGRVRGGARARGGRGARGGRQGVLRGRRHRRRAEEPAAERCRDPRRSEGLRVRGPVRQDRALPRRRRRRRGRAAGEARRRREGARRGGLQHPLHRSGGRRGGRSPPRRQRQDRRHPGHDPMRGEAADSLHGLARGWWSTG